MHRFRFFAAGLALAALALPVFLLMQPGRAAAQQQSCGTTVFNLNDVTFRVLFAKNGAVQQYLLQTSSHNEERDHDALLAAEAKYGPEAVNAPPVQIVSFKPGPGGMMIPDKAVDSCGRITHFH